MGWLRRTHTLRPSAPPSVPLGDAAVHQLSEQPRDDRRATFVGVHLRTSAVAQEITWRTFTACPARAVQTGRADTGWTRAAAVVRRRSLFRSQTLRYRAKGAPPA